MINTHVVSLDLALALRENGYPQEGSTFVHIKTKHARGIYYVTEAIRPLLAMADTEWCAAPLASELGEVLPDKFKSRKLGPAWWCWMPNDSASSVRAVTEPNARAEMWLHLRKASLI